MNCVNTRLGQIALSRPRSASHLLTSAINPICAAADPGRYPCRHQLRRNPGANSANGPTITRTRLLMTRSLLG